MNVQSNSYTYIYSSVMVALVAALLAIAAIKLQPAQERNIEIEKKMSILQSVNLAAKAAEVEDKNAYIIEEYDKYITGSYAVNLAGEKIEGVDAFKVAVEVEAKKSSEIKNLQLKLKKSPDKESTIKPQIEALQKSRQLPIYECNLPDGKKLIIPLRGKGLWGPIWGYISLNDDYNTIYGAVFDHKGETPGLGAEINQSWFYQPFAGKTLFDAQGKFVSITVHKGGKGAAALAGDTEHGVDAISGGTITSKGLEAMLYDCLVDYATFLQKNKAE